jgi:hypothetical protein
LPAHRSVSDQHSRDESRAYRAVVTRCQNCIALASRQRDCYTQAIPLVKDPVPAAINPFARTAIEALGGVDILVNVLDGSSAPGGGFAALDEDIWDREKLQPDDE